MSMPSALPFPRVPVSPLPISTWSDAESIAASTVEVGRVVENDEFE